MSSKTAGKEKAACCGGAAVRIPPSVHDPLCGKSVPADSPYRLDEKGRSHRFCSETCQNDYARAARGEPVDGVAFICAMHPEARQSQPGECALCGMKLAPVRVAVAGSSIQEPAGGVIGRLRAVLRL